ncbi:MAG: diguanylate cyclase [Thermodesulfovibrionales bacterium]|nr:diguanylate cyclase [Thermodesulfovibrionales bacterium]
MGEEVKTTPLKAKILLVEDDKVQAQFVREFLEKKGYEVLWAENGASAIKMAKTVPIDLILLDLILPDISGYEVCRWLRLNQDTRGIPIIMLTVKTGITDKVAGLEAGADDYLPKPFDEAELNARIYASLRTKALQDELKERNRQLEDLLHRLDIMAKTDYLTEIYNRRHFEKILKREFARASRYNHYLSCLMCDIDNFKRINDTYGHAAGDAVLKEVARLIHSSLRENDEVGRWGGEEFVIILPETKKSDAKKVAERILRNIAARRFPGLPENEKITLSIGIATAFEDTNIDNWEKLTKAADEALYMAKRNGRNRVELFGP